MVPGLDRHPNALAVLGPAIEAGGTPSHAYLFHGPGGAGKRELARQFAATLLSDGPGDPAGAHARALAGAHPDLTWVAPSGAHEILVSDIDGPVISAASRTPFESARRVFVIERADRLGDEAANRMLKTLEEPADYVHLILISDRLGDVLPTIRSRCQVVRFDAPSEDEIVAELRERGVPAEAATAYARLGLGDADQARSLADPEGQQLRERAQGLVRLALAGQAGERAAWNELLQSVRARGERVLEELEEQKAAELEMYPRKEHKRVENEWSERIRRTRRRVETGALDQALSIAAAWLLDLAALAWGARDAVRNVDRLEQLAADREVGRAGSPQVLRRAVELIEDTRTRFQLNVSEDLACEALTYRLEGLLAG